jgi:hypothetical protein
MRPVLSLAFSSNELIRCCFLRRQTEKLPSTLRYHETHLCGFSFNPRILLAKPYRGEDVDTLWGDLSGRRTTIVY